MKIKVRCPCCNEEIFIDIDLLCEEELSDDEQKKILDRMGIEFG